MKNKINSKNLWIACLLPCNGRQASPLQVFHLPPAGGHKTRPYNCSICVHLPVRARSGRAGGRPPACRDATRRRQVCGSHFLQRS